MDTRTNNLVLNWVMVTDDSGHTHLESQWVDASHVPAHVPAHVTAA